MSIVPASEALTARLRANWQRRQREVFLKSLPRDLAGLLRDASFITDPDRTPFTQYFCIAPDGAGSAPKIRPPSYEFFDTGLKSRVTEFLRFRVPALGAGPAILALEDDLPCFRVSYEAVAPRFVELLAFAKHGMLLVSDDFTFGVAVSSYCGYHPEEREAEEIVFEIATW